MNVTTVPNDILYTISNFLSTIDKISIRETCKDFKSSISFMEIKIETMTLKIENLINGKNYILARLRLASLCGLNSYKVREIWSWVTLFQEEKKDALPILQQLGEAIT